MNLTHKEMFHLKCSNRNGFFLKRNWRTSLVGKVFFCLQTDCFSNSFFFLRLVIAVANKNWLIFTFEEWQDLTEFFFTIYRMVRVDRKCVKNNNRKRKEQKRETKMFLFHSNFQSNDFSVNSWVSKCLEFFVFKNVIHKIHNFEWTKE